MTILRRHLNIFIFSLNLKGQRGRMTGRERIRKALQFGYPDRVPRNLWKLPGTERYRKGDLEVTLLAYPEDIVQPQKPYARGKREKGERYKKGESATDEGAANGRRLRMA